MEFETVLFDNRNLEEKVDHESQRLAELDLEIEEQERRTELMREHLSQALQLAAFNQQLSIAVTSEADTELSLLRIRSEEGDWTNREISRMNREMKDIQQRMDNCQRSLLGKRQRLQDLQSALVWESETCQEWLGRSIGTTQRHLDAIRVQKEAAAFFRKLNCEVQKLQGELSSWKKNRENVSRIYHSLQAELCRTSDDFSSNHQDRQNILKLWEESVKKLQSVETDLDNRGKELESLRSEWSRQHLLLSAARDSLAKERAVHGALLDQLSQLDSAATALREQLGDQGVTLKAELQALRQEVSVYSMEGRSLRGQLVALQKQLLDKQMLISSLKEQQETLMTSLPKPGSTESDKELNLLRNLIEREKRAQEHCAVPRLRELCSAKENLLRGLSEQRNSVHILVQNCDAKFKTKEAEVHKKRKTLEAKKILLANLDSNLQVLEKRYKRMINGEKEMKNVRIGSKDLKNLEASLKSKLQSKKNLDLKLQQTNEECERLLKNTSKLRCEHALLEESATLTEQDTEALEAGLARLRQENKELSIDNSLLQVTVRQMQYVLEDSNNDVMSAQEQKQKLEASLSQKLKSAKISSESLQSQVNATQNVRHKLSLKLQKEKGRLEGLKARLEVSLSSLPADINDNGSSEIIEKALELKKKRLEQEDVVDAAIRDAQRDLFQLQSCVQSLESANSKTRSLLQTKDPCSSECEQESSELESELKNLLETLYNKRCSLELSNKCIETMKADATEVNKQRENIQSLATEASLREGKIRLALEEQEKKIRRADLRAGSLRNEEDKEKQKCIQLLLLRRIQQTMKNVLSQEARKYPDFYMTFHAMLQ